MTTLDERWLEVVLNSGVSTHVTVIEPTQPVCCCENGHKPVNGFIYTNAGCHFHGVRSNLGQRPVK